MAPVQYSPSGISKPIVGQDDYSKNDLRPGPLPPSGAGANPLVTMAMTMLGNVISNFFQQGPRKILFC